jgi:hypothetical protein
MLYDAGLPERGSNNAYETCTINEDFIVSVILGAKCLANCGSIFHDDVIRKMFGWKGGIASQIDYSNDVDPHFDVLPYP